MPLSLAICTDCPEELLQHFGLATKRGWPAAFHLGPPLLGIGVLVLRELAVGRNTLLLRLLGTGRMLEAALEEQDALDAGALERRATRAALLAVVPPEGRALPIHADGKDPVLAECRTIYRRWAKRV